MTTKKTGFSKGRKSTRGTDKVFSKSGLNFASKSNSSKNKPSNGKDFDKGIGKWSQGFSTDSFRKKWINYY